MIQKYLPLTKIRLEILCELYQKELNLIELSKKLKKSKQLTYQTLNSMEMIYKENNVYFIKKDFVKIFEKILKLNLVEIRLKKYFDSINFIKKYANPKKIFLFGSYLRGENNDNSDIDFLMVSDLNEIEVNELSLRISKLKRIDIQILNIKPSSINDKKNKYYNILQEIKKSKNLGLEIPLELI